MTRYDAVPDVLCARDQWVCWRSAERDGTQTKLPVDPRTKRLASVSDAATWSDFETARTVARDDGAIAGIGFVFTQGDSFVGVDLDAARDPETGRPDEDAKAIVGRLDSYTEVSPSGTGYHVIVDGTLPSGGNRAGTVECYEHARFFTVTGDHVEGTPETIRERQAELAAVHRDYVTGPLQKQSDHAVLPDKSRSGGGTNDSTGSTDGAASAGNGLTDDAVLENARSAKNAEKFTRLWRGTTTGYDSHSEADMALACHLAFWTAKDTAQMDRLFRDSGLYRAKWDDPHYADGRTYGDATIERACRITTDVYTPSRGEASTARDETDTERLARDVARLERTIETTTSERDAIADLTTQVASLATQLEYLNDELATERRKRKRLETKVAMLERADGRSWWQRFRG
ncbi:hypothetical protein EFA46_012645 (plasmid) [Halarchaeum sp. CBA1220]|uniref:phage NrS-1 polymerase family protein n=1 Tax=Halarchaeum sp. CBA1220 TaxID=1853682 RepID=UPI00159FFB78|nr:hypothetical protein [Halarchaeum sp. CBA1220]QLC35098.1 hypothetical protein EFA46_012645 [Halarchaeum sp. CBA1220]